MARNILHMAKYQIENISILIGDSNRQLRSSLKGVLHHHGFRKITDAYDIESFEEAIRVHSPDLILCDVNLKGDLVCEIIHRLRHNHLGQNPFAAVILFIDEAGEEIVSQASRAGLDDLQIKPVVAQKIIDRVKFLIEKRKPFVVTTDYIGPDRRKEARQKGQEIPLVTVPNTLALKATGEFDPNKTQRQIANAVWNVNAQKIERHVFQVKYLVDRIVPAFKMGQVTKENVEMIQRLMNVGQDISKRLKNSDYAHVSTLAATLVTVTKSILQSGGQPKNKDLDLLPELAAALSSTVNAENTENSAVREIQSSIKQVYGK
ncbi:MAG: response regulator [Terasakiella sp.]|uniref:response regulator n=1 Tax=unclassified Terasakiella TaxID=2614952 RepID=UPI003B00DA49